MTTALEEWSPMKIIIRILSFIAAIAALLCAYVFNIVPLYFASIALLLTFLSTFISTKAPVIESGHKVTQEGGHFSTNTQTVNFGTTGKKEDDAKL